jgi:tRNA threonylcarbamoyladenosine biosynthesis protein TsaE
MRDFPDREWFEEDKLQRTKHKVNRCEKSPFGDFLLCYDEIMEHILQGEDEMNAFALEVLRALPQNKEQATVVGLTGDLGSGKTTFAQFFAQGLHIKDRVVSPTYVIAKFYDIPEHSAWSKFVHIDAYRIEHPDEMRMLKWDGIIADPKNIILVEWPERMGELFPHDAVMLQFRFIDQGTRAVAR